METANIDTCFCFSKHFSQTATYYKINISNIWHASIAVSLHCENSKLHSHINVSLLDMDVLYLYLCVYLFSGSMNTDNVQ